MVVRPRALGAPSDVESNGSPVSWQVTPGYTGSLSASVGGLVPATQTAFTVQQDPDQTFNPNDVVGNYSQAFAVPANSVFRGGVFESNLTPTGTDLDVYLYRCAPGCTQVASSADGDSNEVVTHFSATAATYILFVHGWSTNGPSASGTLFSWIVGTTNAGNTTVSGVGPAVTGVTQTHTATFSGLAAGTRYLGRVDYSDGTSTIGRTLLTVTTP
jgi:hypothetical protein